MLVLARKASESIMIGDDIEVRVIAVRGDQVRLGIAAPRHVPVHRREVYEAVLAENRRAMESRQQAAALLAKKLCSPPAPTLKPQDGAADNRDGEREGAHRAGGDS